MATGVEENGMNWDRVCGSWKQFKGRASIELARLIADPRKEMDGRRELLAGKLQEAYGIGRDEAHRQVSDWRKSIREIADAHDAAPHQAGH